ncbi:hypothetical protein DV096_17350 [Bradymonadaceae bacterium TMQ3]|uniref:C4-type zinc ribbon domain-containing protein n=1 Tax=Lujinxingia sediminis TaxID=2480984 RepID=A0ABY0CNY9_9DELT|nr:C4-type zinc ribbon domain-containing protein [Lujinxingia sediminis]RDV36849.1 hypothetical protein DV096_17350 [Bradymonadaceae bacterium TMQ3]RVU42170.1 hypothetical protein EA187_17690 [Lujinxingia sediminis]TXC69472.1 hypothetical protein FRC91_17930 [Bradymonadales bacterium TMQ1]
MKEQLALLRELQNIDLELDEITTKKEEIVGRIQENTGFLDKLVDDLNSQKEELEEIRALQSQKKDDLKEINENLTMRQKRLRDIGSTKEYNAVEKEIESFKKSSEQTEEELLHLLEVIESTQESIKEKEDKIIQLREGIAADEAEAEKRLAELDAVINKLTNRQEEARGQVSKRVIHKYDFIRSRRPGLAVVACKNGHCEGCFMALPPQQYIEVQRGNTLEICPSCNRILYFWEDALGESSASDAMEA